VLRVSARCPTVAWICSTGDCQTRALAVPGCVATGTGVLEVDAVLALAAPLRHESIVVPLGDYSGGPLPGTGGHGQARAGINLQVKPGE
jgi:hypothetical protein